MDKIIDNLTDPAWWFTGLFFVFLLKYSPYLFTLIKEQIRKGSRKYFRAREYKYKCFLKVQRHNLAAVNYQSVKAHAYFLMFVISCSLYLVWYAAGPLFEIQKGSFTLFVICVVPMYMVQIIWMKQDIKAKNLVTEYNKVRVTRRLNGTKAVG
jgi:hypothetical protein